LIAVVFTVKFSGNGFCAFTRRVAHFKSSTAALAAAEDGLEEEVEDEPGSIEDAPGSIEDAPGNIEDESGIIEDEPGFTEEEDDT
ncbi:MAG: hypothetical protein RSC96_08180, partial [Oscillospiraceae bacterium]